MKRYLLPTLLSLNAALLPCGCLPLLIIINPFNPMQVIFITDIQVTNGTDRTLRITPIGAVGREAARSPLPVFRSKAPAFDSSQRGGFIAQPGQTLEILYDMDDINLSEIVVENEAGEVRQIVVDPNPQLNRYHDPYVKTFTIESFEALGPVPANVSEAYVEAQEPIRVWLRSLPFLLLWVTFFLLWRAWRTRRRAHEKSVSGASEAERARTDLVTPA